MRLRTFQARTMTEAMAEIRIALGDDAVILSAETDAAGVRVTAGCEAADPRPSHAATDVADRLYDVLSFHRTPADLQDRLVTVALDLATNDATVALGGALDAVLAFRPVHPEVARRPILLVGPPGQGKTLTAARLAARRVLAGNPVRVIAADPRAGAEAQIAELCRPMDIVPEPLSAGADTHCIIDGPGINPFDADELLAVRDLVARTEAEPVLVLAAGGDPDDAAEIAEAFAAIGARRMIVTRLDAARRLGGVLSAAACGLAVADGGIGRTVADTLVSIQPMGLARVLLAPRIDGEAALDLRDEAA
ncbi:MAG: hypothetical protein ACM30I_04645 [Gemmatimonas sp.]